MAGLKKRFVETNGITQMRKGYEYNGTIKQLKFFLTRFMYRQG